MVLLEPILGEAEKKIYWQFSVSKTNWNYLSACAFVKLLNFKLNCDVRSGMNNNKCFTNGRIMYKTIVSENYKTELQEKNNYVFFYN